MLLVKLLPPLIDRVRTEDANGYRKKKMMISYFTNVMITLKSIKSSLENIEHQLEGSVILLHTLFWFSVKSACSSVRYLQISTI